MLASTAHRTATSCFASKSNQIRRSLTLLLCNQSVKFATAALGAFVLFSSTAAQATTLPAPQFASSTFVTTTGASTVSLTCPGFSSSTIFYTVDGSQPNLSSQSVASGGAVNVTGTISGTTLNAMAVQSGYTNSPVSTANFKADPLIALVLLGYTFWYRSDLECTSSTSSKVSQWLDLSSNNFAATQTTAADQPTIAANAINGYPAVNTASSKYLKLPQIALSNGFGGSVLAMASAANTTSGGIFSLALGSQNAIDLSAASPAVTFTINEISYPSSLTASNAITTGQYALIEGYQTGGSQQGPGSIAINGVTEASGTLSTAPGDALPGYIGLNYTGANYFTGGIAELIGYPESLTESNAQQLAEQYFFTRYQLSNQVPPAPTCTSWTSASFSSPGCTWRCWGSCKALLNCSPSAARRTCACCRACWDGLIRVRHFRPRCSWRALPPSWCISEGTSRT